MAKIAIREWVDQSPDYRPFRQAAHTILTAISGTPDLQTAMVMKGGVLLALGYRSQRHTKDIDFSTSIQLRDFDLDAFRETLEQSLVEAVEVWPGLPGQELQTAPAAGRRDLSHHTGEHRLRRQG